MHQARSFRMEKWLKWMKEFCHTSREERWREPTKEGPRTFSMMVATREVKKGGRVMKADIMREGEEWDNVGGDLQGGIGSVEVRDAHDLDEGVLERDRGNDRDVPLDCILA